MFKREFIYSNWTWAFFIPNKFSCKYNLTFEQFAEGPKYPIASKSQYPKDKMKTTTGPADYSPDKPKRSISYSIVGRKEASPKKTPGPGDYRMKDLYEKI